MSKPRNCDECKYSVGVFSKGYCLPLAMTIPLTNNDLTMSDASLRLPDFCPYLDFSEEKVAQAAMIPFGKEDNE